MTTASGTKGDRSGRIDIIDKKSGFFDLTASKSLRHDSRKNACLRRWPIWLGVAVLNGLIGVGAQAALLPLGLYGHGVVYLDTDAPVERSGSEVRVWSVTDYRQAQTHQGGKTYLSSRSWIAVDCTRQRARVMHLTLFSGARQAGTVVEREGLLHDWLPVVPGSPMQKIHDRYC